MNQMIIEGNACGDPKPEQSLTGSGIAILKVSVAIETKRSYKDASGEVKEETSCYKVVAFGEMAEAVVKNWKEGKSVRIVGRLKQERWKNLDGRDNSEVVVIAEHIEFKKAA